MKHRKGRWQRRSLSAQGWLVIATVVLLLVTLALLFLRSADKRSGKQLLPEASCHLGLSGVAQQPNQQLTTTDAVFYFSNKPGCNTSGLVGAKQVARQFPPASAQLQLLGLPQPQRPIAVALGAEPTDGVQVLPSPTPGHPGAMELTQAGGDLGPAATLLGLAQLSLAEHYQLSDHSRQRVGGAFSLLGAGPGATRQAVLDLSSGRGGPPRDGAYDAWLNTLYPGVILAALQRCQKQVCNWPAALNAALLSRRAAPAKLQRQFLRQIPSEFRGALQRNLQKN